jgi:hypothetical protein
MVTLGLFSNNHPQEEFSQIWLKVREKIFNLIFNQTPLYTTTYALNMASFTFFFPPQNMVTLGLFPKNYPLDRSQSHFWVITWRKSPLPPPIFYTWFPALFVGYIDIAKKIY